MAKSHPRGSKHQPNNNKNQKERKTNHGRQANNFDGPIVATGENLQMGKDVLLTVTIGGVSATRWLKFRDDS